MQMTSSFRIWMTLCGCITVCRCVTKKSKIWTCHMMMFLSTLFVYFCKRHQKLRAVVVVLFTQEAKEKKVVPVCLFSKAKRVFMLFPRVVKASETASCCRCQFFHLFSLSVCLICVVWLDHLIRQKSRNFFFRSLCLICCVWWDQGPLCSPKNKGTFKFSPCFCLWWVTIIIA